MGIEEAVERYSNMLYKICIVILCNEQDTQDAIQDTFCRYMEKKPSFADEEHEKAWLIRVATNICRDIQRKRIRHPEISIENFRGQAGAGCIEELACSLVSEEYSEVLSELLALPAKQKTVIYLHYVEGYRVKEIAGILGISEFAVKKRMQRGREQLQLSWKEAYGK